MIVDSPIQVATDPSGRPRAFRWRGRTYRVDVILDEWEGMGKWWNEDPPEERSIFRVRAEGGVYELDYRRSQGRWYLYRIYD